MKTLQLTDRKEMEDIILSCPYCMMGLADDQGDPYVIPLNFAYDGGVIYLHSGPGGLKQHLLHSHPRVCLTFCQGHELVWMHPQMACSYSMKSASVICRGTATAVEGMEAKRHALDLMMAHYTDHPCGYSDAAVRHVQVWAVKVEDMTGRRFGLRPSEAGTGR